PPSQSSVQNAQYIYSAAETLTVPAGASSVSLIETFVNNDNAVSTFTIDAGNNLVTMNPNDSGGFTPDQSGLPFTITVTSDTNGGLSVLMQGDMPAGEYTLVFYSFNQTNAPQTYSTDDFTYEQPTIQTPVVAPNSAHGLVQVAVTATAAASLAPNA